MSAYYFIYALVLCGVPISLIDDAKIRRQCQVLYFTFILTVLAIFAGLRSPSVDHDYLNYVDWFNSIAAGTAATGLLLRDPAFGLISWVVSGVGGKFLVVALIYAVLAVLALSYFAIAAVSNRWLTLYFYLLFCDYFIVGEMTEIRSMVAIPLMAISLYFACSGDKKRSIGIYILGLTFHFSIIISLPILVLLLMGVQFRSRWWVIAFVPLSFVAIFFFNPIIEAMTGFYRISEAANQGVPDNDLSRSSWTALVHLLVIAACLLWAWKRLSLHHRVATIFSGLGLSLLLIFISNSELGFRFLALYEIYWLLLLIVLMEMLQGYKRLLYCGALCLLGFGLYNKSLQAVVPYVWQLASR
jgi:hypothetical protein